MRTPKLPAAASLVATMAAGVLLAGCSGEVHAGIEKSLPADKLSTTVAEKLAAQTGQPKPDVTCPEDLDAEVGATGRCELTAADGTKIGLSVTVSSVEGSQVNFDIKVDDKVAAN